MTGSRWSKRAHCPAELTHRDSRVEPVAHDVSHNERKGRVAEPEDVVPVAADVERLAPGLVDGRDLTPSTAAGALPSKPA